MPNDPAVKREAIRVDAKLARLQNAHTDHEQFIDDLGEGIVAPKERVAVCKSCFARADMPHRDKCELTPHDKPTTPIMPQAMSNDLLLAKIEAMEAELSKLREKKTRGRRKKKGEHNGSVA